ncbi:sugar ABC transporter ATP-binding protein [Clostridium aestuarii]|uniref:Sugar ABC transporter ATP-binding protein n=1 Tax=Clostridium aestuarii TaxID=338193 RepID=A0ABT4D0A4_9CLOT|nr:sugar ABC transporter ATP-binding protein [Clostridium aestuarii]MCY6484668.1 sugar ABC transporter ATP-binding protein [Clostridium aestuarii]
MSNKEVFLKLQDIRKTFSGVRALDGIQLEVKKGEVHALVGENGAGKSTLIKVLTGVHQPDEGAEIFIEGEQIKKLNPLFSVRKGISVIYQDFSLFPNLTVAENIAISFEIEKGRKHVNWKAMKDTAKKAIESIGVDIDINIQAGKLSVGKQQLVAIARALVYDAKMIIMDEPTSALSKNEVQALFKIINKLREKNISVLFVSHKLEELFEIADRFTVIRDGKYIGDYDKSELDNDKLIALMVGRKVEIKRYEKNESGDTLLEIKGFSKKGNFKDISFKLNKGEIVGFTGLVGAGRTELAQAIFGINLSDEGEMFIENKKIEVKSTEQAVANGIAYVPESRKTEGLILPQSVEDNIAVTIFHKLVKKLNIIDVKKKKEIAEEWIKKLDIRPAMSDMITGNMSGGNQQKVVIAKWLARNPKILIVDEPTNGIDVGAKSSIHQLLRDLAAQGMGIIMISSELPEILAVSDRILVMRRGKITAEFDGNDVTQEQIMNKSV